MAVATISGVSFYAFKSKIPITNYPPQGETIVAFGDSLIEGVGATTGMDFPALLSEKINEPILNMGASGETTAQGLTRVDEVIAQNPGVVLILFGGNDYLHKIPIEETFKNIDEIVVKLQSKGAVVILLGIQGGILTDPYEKYFENIAKSRGTLYIPNVLDGIIGRSKFMDDGIHPNNTGYQKIAEKIYPVLEKALK